MSEFNPEAPVVIQFSNKRLELNLERTAAFTFRQIGHLALNHLWLTDEDESGQKYATYIWFNKFGNNDEERSTNFNLTLDAMSEYGYEMHLNLKEPTEFDIDNYVNEEFSNL